MTNHVRSFLRSMKAVVASVSGILHNNQDIIGEYAGKPFKGLMRSHYDGQGVSLLRAIGIPIAFVHVDEYSPDDPICMIINRWNSLPSATKPEGEGRWPQVELINGYVGEEQVAPVRTWLAGLGLTFSDCAILGHDLVQVPLLRLAGLRVVPAQAEDVVKRKAHVITKRSGGNGAFRDFANLVLKARGIDPTTLPTR